VRIALRTGLKAVACLSLTLGCFAVFCAGLLVLAPLRRRLHWRDRILSIWSRILLRVLAVRLTVVGPIPRGGCLLVANHLSYLDVLVLAAVRPLSFLSKAEVAQWPLVGFMARVIGVQFIAREDKRSLPQVAARLLRECQAGHGVVFFPEGTSASGDAVLPFRAALLAPAAATGLLVHYAAMRYRTPEGEPPAREAVAWWGDMLFLPHLRGLLRLRCIEAEVRFGAAPLVAADRKELARRLQDGVVALLAQRGRMAP